MNTASSIRPLALALLLASAALPPIAQAQPQQGKSGAASWIGGGVGQAEFEAITSREKEHALKLVFTLIEGNYLAGVDVTVRDAAGATVLEQRNTGPLLLVQLPRGSYVVTASSEGRVLTRKVQVGDRLRTEYLRWPALPERDFALPPGAPGAPAR